MSSDSSSSSAHLRIRSDACSTCNAKVCFRKSAQWWEKKRVHIYLCDFVLILWHLVHWLRPKKETEFLIRDIPKRIVDSKFGMEGVQH